MYSNDDFEYVVVMGAATGGKHAMENILSNLPEDFEPILVVQNIPPRFIGSYVKFLQKNTKMEVIESKTGDLLKRGRVIVATGYHQMRIAIKENKLYTSCIEEGSYNGNCPSIDVLFESCAKVINSKCIGVLLSGISYDGCNGLLKIKKFGGYTIVQDQKSCIAKNKCINAVKIGAATKQVQLSKISEELKKYVEIKNYKKCAAII